MRGRALIISAMHRWLLILLIALVPLRGWVGEAMAGQMLAQQLDAIESVAASAHAERAAGHSDTQMAAHDCHSAAPLAAPAEGSCASCVQCQVCSVLVLPAAAEPAPAGAGQAVPPSRGAHFDSAPPAPLFKPPIS